MIIEIIARDEGGRLVCYPKRTRGRSEEVKRRQIEACRFLNGDESLPLFPREPSSLGCKDLDPLPTLPSDLSGERNTSERGPTEIGSPPVDDLQPMQLGLFETPYR